MALDDEDLFDSPAQPKKPSNKIVYQPPGAQWSLDRLPEVESLYQSSFKKRLPLVNRGQGSIHNKWGYDHRNSADVSINPATPEGQQFTEQLKKANVPFLAFTGAIPGVATGPHIHIGFPSHRTQQKFNVGAQKKTKGIASDDLFDSPQKIATDSDSDLFDSPSPEQPTPRPSAGTRTPPRATAAPANIEQALSNIMESTNRATERLQRQAAQSLSGMGELRRIDDPVTQRMVRNQQQTREDVIRERRGRVGAYGAPTPSGMLHLITNPVDSLTGLFRSEDENVKRETDERLRQQRIASEPEVTDIRKEYGQMPAAVRSVAAPVLGRGGGGLLKTAGGIASLFGIAPNQLSDWANKRGEIVETASSMIPLDPQLKEVERGIPEKLTTAAADVGVGIGKILLLKKATGLSFPTLMALEGAATNSEKPINQRLGKAAEGYALGQALDAHLSRGTNAALFAIPSAAQTGYEVSQGRMSPLDAAIQTGIQAGAGALLTPGRKSSLEQGLARETPRERVEPNAEMAARLRGEGGTQAEVRSPVEVQRAEVESAAPISETIPTRPAVDRASAEAEPVSGSESQPARFFHRDSDSLVVESPNQSRISQPDKRVRVVLPNGRERVVARDTLVDPDAHYSNFQERNEAGEFSGPVKKPEPSPRNRASVKMFITRADEAALRDRGYSQAEINAMKPADAQRVLESQPIERMAETENMGEVADVNTASSAASPWEVPREPLSAKPVTEPVTKAEESTSLKNVASNELRKDLDLTEIERPEKRAWQTSIDNAQAKGLDKQVDQIADKVIKGNREVALDLEESAALLIKTRELENQWEQTYRANPNDPQLAEIKSQLDKYSTAADLGGTETARALNFRRAMVDKEFRLISLIRQAEKAKGREVTPVEIARYEQIVKERDAAIAQRDAALEQARVADLQRQINREGRRARRSEQKKTLDDEALVIRQNIANEIARIRTQSIQPSGLARLDPEGVITKELLKYARNRIKANVGLKAEALIDEVHGLVKGLGATRQQVSEALASGRKRQMQRDEATRRLAEVRREIAKIVNDVDVAAGRRSLRQEGPKRDFQRNQQRLTQLEKREAEYERRVREHDFEPKEKKEFPYVPEVRAAERRVEIAEAKFYKEMKRAEGGHQLRNLSGIYKAWLLSGPLTHVKNIGGTMGYQVFSEGARLPSVIADAALSTITKQRGISGPSPSAMLQSVENAIRIGGREAVDIMRQGATKEQMERHQYQEIDFGVNTGKPVIDKGVKAIELAHNVIFRFMSASDRVAYQFALKRNLIDRANIQARNEGLTSEARRTRAKELVEHPPEQLEADAKHDALVNTFNNNNALSTKIKAARAATIKNPNLSRKAAQRINAAENLALDLVLPFDRTPTNVVMRILEASPAGYLKNAGQLVKSAINKSMSVEDQRQFSQTFGKATAGTALIALGWKLADELFDVDDKGIVSLKLGSRTIRLDYISPLGNLIATGVRLRKAHDEEKGPAEDAKIVGREVSNIPVLRATSGLSETMQDPARSAGKTAARFAFGAVPFSGAVRFAGDVLDPKEREAKGFKENFQRNVPVWRQQLPEHVDRRRQRAELGEAVRVGRRTPAELEQMVREGQITEARKQQILRDSKLSAKQARFSDYTPSVALDRFERMDPSQREEVREQMEKKAYNLTHSDTLTEQQKTEFQQRLDRLGIVPRGPRKSTGEFKDLFKPSASPF